MVSAKATEQVETLERRTGSPAEDNGHPGGATAVEQAARDHVWIHQLPWAEFESDNLRIFDRGEGARLYDVHGREYLDGIAGLWVVKPAMAAGRSRRRTPTGRWPGLRLGDDLYDHTRGQAGREARQLAPVT